MRLEENPFVAKPCKTGYDDLCHYVQNIREGKASQLTVLIGKRKVFNIFGHS